MNTYNTHFVAFPSGRSEPVDVDVRNRMYPDAAAAMEAATADYPAAHIGVGAQGFIIRENSGPVIGSWFSNPAVTLTSRPAALR